MSERILERVIAAVEHEEADGFANYMLSIREILDEEGL